MDRSMLCGFTPRPTDNAPCGSKSTSSTRRPYSASAAPRLIAVVVLPTPPFWLHIEITLAQPCWVSGRGSGRWGVGRPVGPRTAVATAPRSSGSSGKGIGSRMLTSAGWRAPSPRGGAPLLVEAGGLTTGGLFPPPPPRGEGGGPP